MTTIDTHLNADEMDNHTNDMIIFDVEYETLNNTDYRRVISTSNEMQLVLMSISPGDQIPREVHPTTTQLIRVESGKCLAVLEYIKDSREYDRERRTYRHFRKLEKVEKLLTSQMVIFIPSGVYHTIINAGSDDLKINTVYAPPAHPRGLIQEQNTD